ncbi:unnamed protein product [Polarella glacialis]|uniref:SCP domain-containing protein n=1 Tax=Polarella glacialis TaxID=89957 RepID=A0A813I4Y2_POLGL|nr:unnamed protein product [Polarella glacialis]
MLLDDGSPERGHRANLLNGDFHFLGVSFGKHPSAETAAVVLFADHFKAKPAKQAQLMLEIAQQHQHQHQQKQHQQPQPQQQVEVEGGRQESVEDSAQRAWDQLMHDVKPPHLSVSTSVLKHVHLANRQGSGQTVMLV